MPHRSYTFGKRGDGQFTLNLDGALGCPFGSSFRMDRVSNKMFSITKTENPVTSLDIGKLNWRLSLINNAKLHKICQQEFFLVKNHCYIVN